MIDIRSFKSNTCNEAENAKTFIYKIVFYSDLSKLLQDGRTTASLKICIQDQGHCHFLNSFCASYYNPTYLPMFECTTLYCTCVCRYKSYVLITKGSGLLNEDIANVLKIVVKL